MNINNYIIIFKELFAASKSLIYSRYLITVFPFYAILIYNGLIGSMWDILLLIPFVPLYAAGFMYNTLCDAEQDPKEKNPVTSGALSKKSLLTSTLISITLSILIFILTYSSKTALLLFLILIFLWLAYSGLKIRFKETILGPPIASIVLYIAPSVIILSEFNFLNINTMSLILGIFFIYTGHEILHTIIDYESDISFKCRTFAVIAGRKTASMVEYVFLIVGFILLLVSFNYFTVEFYLFLLFAIIFFLSVLSTISYGIYLKFRQNTNSIFVTLPYIATIIFLIILGCLILNLSLLLTLFIVWMFMISR